MMDFEDEFSESELVKKPDTPIQYVKLEDTALVKRDLDTFPEFLRDNALNKYQLIVFIDKKISGGWTQKNLDPILDVLFTTAMDKRPNWRTLVRWRKSYIESDGDLASLVVKRHKMGNRTSRVKGDEVFFEQALTRFLDAKRPRVSTAYQYYRDAITIENESIVDGQIPIISYKSFNRRIKSLPPYPVAVARHGKFIADQWFAYCSSHIHPTRILERVEIDHTPLDLILIDDELSIPIGRPYLTLIIDVFSSCVLGFHLSYRAPSYVSAAKAIVHAIKPKSFEGLGIELQNEWPCFGKFETLVVDNGAEFWSKSLEHACKEAGINIQYNPVRKPWLKPIIERFFGMINECFLTDIPGKTFSNILAKEDYKPEKDAIMRFSTFVEEFHRWIVDIYHQDSDSRETRIPIKQWQRGFDILPPLKMSVEDEQRFTMLMGITDERTLTRNGFKYQELMYDSTALADYRKRYPQTKESIKKLIKVDPDDLSYIHVYLEELGGYIKVPCTDNSNYTNGLSLHEHKVIKQVNREIIREGKDNLGLAKARMAIHARVKQEQEAFQISNKKAKISGVKMQAQLADVSNTGQGTIRLESEELFPSLPKKSESNISNLLEHWDDDLEAFE
ncbi:transposase family protein [Shewanella xiamenensis]|uniref:Transposase n=2 Tax=Shewanella xiamenensis TaxID=332186 RepID=A0AAW6QXZ3_9GAMM|nr:transposase family protein [Shewanella xiamenensis]MDG5901012.1 transposase [Shewanella xiamenensis]MDH1628553.1 transposase family protein [Shewanella xiamenensis]BDA62855.1 transposase [Shewanella xiamenensis]